MTRGTELPSTAIPVPPNCGATTSRTQAQAMDGSGQLGMQEECPAARHQENISRRREKCPVYRTFSCRLDIFPIDGTFFLSVGHFSRLRRGFQRRMGTEFHRTAGGEDDWMCSACGVPSFCPWRRPEAESGQDSSRILTLIHEYRHYFVKNAAGAKLEGFRGKTRGYPATSFGRVWGECRRSEHA